MPQKTPMCYFRRPRQSSTVALEARKSEIGVLTAENYINGYFQLGIGSVWKDAEYNINDKDPSSLNKSNTIS